MITNEELRARHQAQREQADADSRRQIATDAFLSHPDKFQISAEGGANQPIIFSTFEWGESREEVGITDEDAERLRDWLIERFPLDLEPNAEVAVDGFTIRVHLVDVKPDFQWSFWTLIEFHSAAARATFVAWLSGIENAPGCELVGARSLRVAPAIEVTKEA